MRRGQIKVEVYGETDFRRKGPWRWRLTAANGRIIGASSEGYVRKARCWDNLLVVTGWDALAMSVRGTFIVQPGDGSRS